MTDNIKGLCMFGQVNNGDKAKKGKKISPIDVALNSTDDKEIRNLAKAKKHSRNNNT